MKKTFILFLFFAAGILSANDYKWDLVNALTKSDYPAAEAIINRYINNVPANEKSLMMNFALTYSGGETTLRVLNLLHGHNVRSRENPYPCC